MEVRISQGSISTSFRLPTNSTAARMAPRSSSLTTTELRMKISREREERTRRTEKKEETTHVTVLGLICWTSVRSSSLCRSTLRPGRSFCPALFFLPCSHLLPCGVFFREECGSWVVGVRLVRVSTRAVERGGAGGEKLEPRRFTRGVVWLH